MPSLGTKQQWHTGHGSKSLKQSSKNNNFKEKRHLSESLFTEAKMLNLTKIITLIIACLSLII